jgi:hypothetical protein
MDLKTLTGSLLLAISLTVPAARDVAFAQPAKQEFQPEGRSGRQGRRLGADARNRWSTRCSRWRK